MLGTPHILAKSILWCQAAMSGLDRRSRIQSSDLIGRLSMSAMYWLLHGMVFMPDSGDLSQAQVCNVRVCGLVCPKRNSFKP